MTLKQFIHAHDSFLLTSWDHTAQLSAMLDGVICTVINVNSKHAKARPRTVAHFHPFKETQQTGCKVNYKNFKVLRYMANAAVQR